MDLVLGLLPLGGLCRLRTSTVFLPVRVDPAGNAPCRTSSSSVLRPMLGVATPHNFILVVGAGGVFLPVRNRRPLLHQVSNVLVAPFHCLLTGQNVFLVVLNYASQQHDLGCLPTVLILEEVDEDAIALDDSILVPIFVAVATAQQRQELLLSLCSLAACLEALFPDNGVTSHRIFLCR